MTRMSPPFRADHVGSLLRPPELHAARERHAAGELDAAALRALEDEAIRGVVALQEELGLQSVTDGEFRRRSWQMDFLSQLGGVSVHEAQLDQNFDFRTAAGTLVIPPMASLRVEAPLHLTHTIFGEDFAALRSYARTGLPKQTIPSPSMLYIRGGRAMVDANVYQELDAFWADLVATYVDELERMHALGCRYLQIDDVSLAMLNDPAMRARLTELGDDGEAAHLLFIRQLGEVLARKPEGMAVTTHLCRGNFLSAWAAAGSYDFVAEALFSELAVDGFFLEYDDERSGGFEPLRFVPKGRMVVLGLVTTKRGELESKDELKRRIEEASRYIPLEQLCLSPQCGFASTAEGNALTQEQQAAKLRLVVETAAELWR
jgi:5-methyltetrahydropteroyltriglutamate--homocysteine methyltransferase